MSDSQRNDNPSAGKSMKVTDRRMFTTDGELREEYRHLDEKGSGQTGSGQPGSGQTGSGLPETGAGEPAPSKPEPEPAPPEPEPEPPPGQPAFEDLVRLLAEHTSIYLQHASMPDGDQMQHLELAKLHIDLLGVLKDKTAGNLTSREQALIDDVLYRLRLAFAGQRGF